MTTNTDQYYITSVCAGRVNDFSFIVEKYKDMVFTLCLRMLKDREEAEEVAQDTFVKAFKSITKFKGDAKFSTWLYRIAYNACIDNLKSRKKTIKSDLIDKVNPGDLGEEENAVLTMEREERKRVIEKAIGNLPEEDRAIITLFYFEELSLHEISSVIGITPNNIKVRLFRSRKKLYDLLKSKAEILNVRNYEG
ncbi:RNA polymerase sigma factor [Abyssalbus ytuae]|uniref:RNA polymerase sigma factor n=1 Tax=Abyssalbus ytuae TaxID=2926907 RepID=A0A9E7CUA0_9FLAO|nr:RNA polymerase sigma factor [Abyssalbus ytuae]UOB18012.1 RNA polymerase sigma factor [Abyssalbus ytuae]